ncbi:MAG: efflux RND transporter periplasmic adaptor subunit [Xanthobacteraceae bacterium]|nr:efflux RND transporter periplasmic adaptor subunit [Xanthobacteraceae bacterium]
MRTCLASVAGIAATIFILFSPAYSHEGHDHDLPIRTAAPIAPRGEAESGGMQLVAVLRDAKLVIYLDKAASNEPVTDAAIEVLTPYGTERAELNPDGTYRISAKWADGRDHYDLIFTVTHAERSEVFAVTIVGPTRVDNFVAHGVSYRSAALITIAAGLVAFLAGVFAVRRFPRFAGVSIAVVAAILLSVFPRAQAHDGHDESEPRAAQAGSDMPQRLADGTIFLPKSVQRLLEIGTAIVESGEHTRTIELPGRIVPDANASGYVQSTLAGRLLPPPNGFPALGSRVEKGQVLAYVEPPIQAIDVSDMRQKEGELLQQIAIVERRVARFESLVEKNAVPRTQLEDARTELEGLRNRKAQLEKIRREPEVLVAPVGGVIAEANTIAGQLAQPSTVVFQIVDPARLWVEALSFDAIRNVQGATARTHDGQLVKLAFRGSAAALRNQSIAIQFAIDGDTKEVWAGQFVNVFVSVPDNRRGIPVPRGAVVRNASGQHVVFEHVTAERFEPRQVRFEPLDAGRVLVTGGLTDGKRIVVRGAELLDQVR